MKVAARLIHESRVVSNRITYVASEMCQNVPDSGSDMFPIHMSVHDVRSDFTRSCRVLTREHVSNVTRFQLDADLCMNVFACHLCKLIGVMLYRMCQMCHE